MLSEFLERQPGKRLHYFAALHLLHSLASGLEDIHRMGEYHGDLHTDNIIVQRSGLKFDLKILDLYKWGRATAESLARVPGCGGATVGRSVALAGNGGVRVRVGSPQ